MAKKDVSMTHQQRMRHWRCMDETLQLSKPFRTTTCVAHILRAPYIYWVVAMHNSLKAFFMNSQWGPYLCWMTATEHVSSTSLKIVCSRKPWCHFEASLQVRPTLHSPIQDKPFKNKIAALIGSILTSISDTHDPSCSAKAPICPQ